MKGTRREFIKSAAAAGLVAAAPGLPVAAHAAIAGTRSPNILMLFPDQWRFDWMSENPAFAMRTPNIDRLVERGTRFTKAIVASPLCAPSRACLAAGVEYEKNGTPNNDANYPNGKPTIYERLRKAGYHVLGCGKMDLAKASSWWGLDGKWRTAEWGFSDAINCAGKQDQLLGYSLNGNRPADPYLSFLETRGLLKEHIADYDGRLISTWGNTDPTPLPDDAYGDNWIAAGGLKMLDTAPPDKPWFMQVNFAGPHPPEDITVSMEKKVRGRPMPAVVGADEFSAPKDQFIRQNYTAMCENIDRLIGQYLDRLEATGQLANTLVIFSSDHGEMLGDHGRWGKKVPYQASVSVPMVIAGPGVRVGAETSALVSSIDLSSTILDYAGVTVPRSMDGISLRPVLAGKTDTHRKVVYSGLGGWRMVWDGRHKVVTGFATDLDQPNPDNVSKYEPYIVARSTLVFDLDADPSENTNLSNSMPGNSSVLLEKLKASKYAV